jgi:enamine deaminase RidA (YjgF/YER057c/UK114 family)
MAGPVRFINPETLHKPPTYTQVVEATGPGRTIFISGQLGGGLDGKLVGSDFRSQAVQVFENLKAGLTAVGASFKDVVKVNSYLADINDLPVLRDVRIGYLNAAALPASTTLGGLSFARNGALLEVELVAVLPARATKAHAAKAGRKARSARKAARPRRRKGK